MNRLRSRPAPVEILLVEDNRPDARLIEEILRQGRVPKNISVVTEGDEALAFLQRRGVHAPRWSCST